MRTILFILRKEFLQIFRNKSMLPIIFMMPVIQLLVLSNVASFEIKNLKMHVIDLDQSSTSRLLISKFDASPYFEIVNTSFSNKTALRDFKKDEARLILEIPHNFDHDLMTKNLAKLQLSVNAIDGSAAGLTNAYASSIIRDFNSQIVAQWVNYKTFEPFSSINISYSFWFNPDMNYKTFMVPGILVMLVTMIGVFLSGMNIVKEKEAGTIEQLNVTPIRKHHFIIGKLLPFWILALFELAIGLTVGKLVFNIPFVGSVGLIFGFASLYLLVVLGLGLLLSTLADTQQQAMFIAFFFLIIFILMSGLFTPIESMPHWAQVITWFNPVAYFVEVMRMIMLKGAGLVDIQKHIMALSFYALTMLSLATWRYRKTS